jgi:hypothetical protein
LFCFCVRLLFFLALVLGRGHTMLTRVYICE